MNAYRGFNLAIKNGLGVTAAMGRHLQNRCCNSPTFSCISSQLRSPMLGLSPPRQSFWKQLDPLSENILHPLSRQCVSSRERLNSVGIRCISINRTRGPLWKSRNLGREAMEVVQDLVWSKGDQQREDAILETKGMRLLKVDLLAVLFELERQGNWRLSLKVFEMVRKEPWYHPDPVIYARLIVCLGKGKQPALAQAVFDLIADEGVEPNDLTYMSLIGAYCRSKHLEKALQVFQEMKEKSVLPTETIYKILIRTCRRVKSEALVKLMQERDYLYPEGIHTKPKKIKRR